MSAERHCRCSTERSPESALLTIQQLLIYQSENARAAVIGISVVITFLLESKDKVRKFFSETLTGNEFSGTLLFLALVFIIYPILPEGDYGPYGGFTPRDIWAFVILVSFVSFSGYFLEKYMGASSGLKVTAILGGIASTTATTLSLAKVAKNYPEKINTYWQAATLANAIQFPRLFAFLSVISPPISRDAAFPLLAAGLAGIAMAFLIPTKDSITLEPDKEKPSIEEQVESESSKSEQESTKLSEPVNPLTLGPALKCGLILAIVVFINKVVVSTMGVSGLVWTSSIGGLVDVDAIDVSAADLFRDNRIVPDRAVGSVLIAVCGFAVSGRTYETWMGKNVWSKLGITEDGEDWFNKTISRPLGLGPTKHSTVAAFIADDKSRLHGSIDEAFPIAGASSIAGRDPIQLLKPLISSMKR